LRSETPNGKISYTSCWWNGAVMKLGDLLFFKCNLQPTTNNERKSTQVKIS
jgi:hypothetical protein